MSTKAILKDTINSNKSLFESRNDDSAIVKATIAYAVYRATGGVKLIPMPPFTDQLYNMANRLATFRVKSGRDITSKSIDKLNMSIRPNYFGIDGVCIIEDKAIVKIGSICHTVSIYKDINELITKIICICINLMDICNIDEELYNSIYSYYTIIGR